MAEATHKITSPSTYDVSFLEEKKRVKSALQKKLNWPKEPKQALIILPTGLTKELGGELLEEVIEGLLTLPANFLILGKGSSSYGKMAIKLAEEHNHRIAIVPNKKAEVEAMYTAADIALFLSKSDNLEEVAMSLAHGVVPVSPTNKSLKDYDPVQESGNSFMYKKTDKWNCFAAVVRALETYVFPFDWKTVQKQCMKSVFSD